MHIINLTTEMPKGKNVKKKTLEDWEKEGVSLFGKDKINWRFVCPNCGNIQSPDDFRKYKDEGADPSTAYFSCIGRFMENCDGTISNKKSPCNYTQGGLFILSQIIIVEEDGTQHKVFDFDRSKKLDA